MKIGIKITAIILSMTPLSMMAQDLSEGLIINDMELHPMEDIEKPDYLNTIIDPSFGTTIRRITNAGQGEVIVPMYSTIQAWNADESMMILYNQSKGIHELLDGQDYHFVRELDDVYPDDLEQIFWDFNNPDIFYYPENATSDFIRYTVSSQEKETIVNIRDISNCEGGFSLGNDVQMMSWDSDVFTFRCNNEVAYSYRISTEELTPFTINDLGYTAPSSTPSGTRYYHRTSVYDLEGNFDVQLNENSTEHSCIGKLPNGNDAHFAIAFAQGPEGECIGDIIAHDMTTGLCFPVISQSQGYDYPQSGTHISALAHKNTEGGWIAASMVGYDQNGQELLDQELVIAKTEEGNIKVCRIGHHRSDEDQFDYWGEPHAVISPTGTRVLFASDWSGAEDGLSVDSYVVELPAYTPVISSIENPDDQFRYKVFPNPISDKSIITFENKDNRPVSFSIYNTNGEILKSDITDKNQYHLNLGTFLPGLYFFNINDHKGVSINGRFLKG